MPTRRPRPPRAYDGRLLPQFENPDGTVDPSRNKPKTWNHRHQLILYMVMAGKPVKEIGEALGYHPDRVSTIKNSPLFQAQLRQLTEELKHVRLGDFLAQCTREAIPNLEFLVKMRDDPLYHDGDPNVRVKAAAQVAKEVERAFPRTRHHTEDRNIRITLDAQALQQMALALADADGKDAFEADFVALPEPTEDQVLNPKAVDQLLAELEAQADPTEYLEAERDPAADAERRD